MEPFDSAIKLANEKKFEEAKRILEYLLIENPNDPEILYNLGMLFSELGEPDKAIEHLTKCIVNDTKQANAYVALGYAYFKKGDNELAKKYSLQALEIEPNNPYAHRNLGGVYGKEHLILKSLYHLRRSYEINPNDVNTVYGLGLAYKDMDDLENADKFMKKILEMRVPPDIRNLAKDARREIAEKIFKSRGMRSDAVFYCLDALNIFKAKSPEEIQRISFEISILGQSGIDLNNPSKKYSLKSLEGTFSGLYLVSLMYVGFKKINHDLDIGFDLSKEYEAALNLFNQM